MDARDGDDVRCMAGNNSHVQPSTSKCKPAAPQRSQCLSCSTPADFPPDFLALLMISWPSTRPARHGKREPIILSLESAGGRHRVQTNPCPLPDSPGPRVETRNRGDRADFRVSKSTGSANYCTIFHLHLLALSRSSVRRIHSAPSKGPIVASWHFRQSGPAAVSRACRRSGHRSVGVAEEGLSRRDDDDPVCDGTTSVLARPSTTRGYLAIGPPSPVLRPPGYVRMMD